MSFPPPCCVTSYPRGCENQRKPPPPRFPSQVEKPDAGVHFSLFPKPVTFVFAIAAIVGERRADQSSANPPLGGARTTFIAIHKCLKKIRTSIDISFFFFRACCVGISPDFQPSLIFSLFCVRPLLSALVVFGGPPHDDDVPQAGALFTWGSVTVRTKATYLDWHGPIQELRWMDSLGKGGREGQDKQDAWPL